VEALVSILLKDEYQQLMSHIIVIVPLTLTEAVSCYQTRYFIIKEFFCDMPPIFCTCHC